MTANQATAPAGSKLPALVAADELLTLRQDPKLVVLDATVVRDDRQQPSTAASLERWTAAHVPGSRHADLTGRFSDPDSPFSFTNPGPERLGAAFGELGVRADSRLVVYDDDDRLMWATRLWWLARAIGFDNVLVLDGGFSAWLATGNPVESGPAAAGSHLPPLPVLPVLPRDVLIDKAEVQRLLAGGTGAPLICALDEAVFTGQDGGYARRGHIPGASNVPARSLIGADRRFADPATLAELLAGYRGAAQVNVYCGGGISATVVAFALVNLGWSEVRVYDGSLEEWAADPELPMAVGP